MTSQNWLGGKGKMFGLLGCLMPPCRMLSWSAAFVTFCQPYKKIDQTKKQIPHRPKATFIKIGCRNRILKNLNGSPPPSFTFLWIGGNPVWDVFITFPTHLGLDNVHHLVALVTDLLSLPSRSSSLLSTHPTTAKSGLFDFSLVLWLTSSIVVVGLYEWSL